MKSSLIANMISGILFISTLVSAINVTYDREKNIIELTNDIIVKENSCAAPARGVVVFTPKAPFDNATFIITIPLEVTVGKDFVVDYAIRTENFCAITYWSDLIPDVQQSVAKGLQFIKNDAPSMGIFNPQAQSLAKKGAKGSWLFPNGLAASSLHHLNITLRAQAQGTYQYVTQIATNPPSLFGPVGIVVNSNQPKSMISAGTPCNRAIQLCVDDEDSGLVKIIEVGDPQNGSVSILNNNTLSYCPHDGFIGEDVLNYTVQDESGRYANGMIAITVIESLLE